jgi:hypothetical protein
MNEAFEWFEQLPDQCPPSDAECPDGKVFFRMIRPDGPTSDCFLPTIWNRPIRDPRFTPCIQKSVSLFITLQDLMRARKIGEHQLKDVVRLHLPKGSGLIAKTGSAGHYSWWRDAKFDPVGSSNPLTH